LATARTLRSPLAVTFSVWKALFLREAAMRLARDPMAWFWTLAEPLGHIAFLTWLFVSGFRQRQVVGADTAVFLMLGILVFFLPRNMLNRSIAVVEASEALYNYRQVKPIDTVIARVGLETLLGCLVFIVAITGGMLFGLHITLADPLGALYAAGALWLAGLGLALVFSVLAALSPQVRRIVQLARGALYLLSAVIYPSSAVPASMRDTLLLNPLVHGVEAFRMAFLPNYKVPSGIDLGYLVQFAVLMIFLGLALHVRFQDVLRAK
jgi:capsular polysaccharide transport system permease protein